LQGLFFCLKKKKLEVMIILNSKALRLNLNASQTQKYLFKSPWLKNVIDYERKHHHLGFTKLIKTEDSYVVSTTNFSSGNDETKAIDLRLSKLTQTEVSTHFVCILPKLSTGEHYDQFDSPTARITTSLVSYVSGDICVLQNGCLQKVTPNRSTLIDIQQLHEGINHSNHLSWCITTLFYEKTYADIKTSLKKYILDDFD
jgi:hypothetical protein